MSFITNNLGLLLTPFLGVILYRYGPHVHRNEYRYFFVATLLSFFMVSYFLIATFLELSTYIPVIHEVFYMGHFSFALYSIVMFTGAFKHQSSVKIALSKVRRELSIMGFILLLPHVFFQLDLALSGFNQTGFLAFLLMLPLFVTSFPQVRKKMHPVAWVKLHRWSYGVYFFLFLHVAFDVYTNPLLIRFSSYAPLYILFFALYLVLKINNYPIKQRA